MALSRAGARVVYTLAHYQVQPYDNPMVALPWDHLDVVPDKPYRFLEPYTYEKNGLRLYRTI